MIYYAKDNKLYATEVAVSDMGFVQITVEEYNSRLKEAVSKREKGIPSVNDFSLSEE